MSITEIQHSEHKGLWIKITETANSFKVENMLTDENEVACYKSKLILNEPIYFFKGKATDTMKDLLTVEEFIEQKNYLVKQALSLHNKEEMLKAKEAEIDSRISDSYARGLVDGRKEGRKRMKVHEMDQFIFKVDGNKFCFRRKYLDHIVWINQKPY